MKRLHKRNTCFAFLICLCLQPLTCFKDLKAENHSSNRTSVKPKPRNCRKSTSQSIFDNFEFGCVGIVCSDKNECGYKIEFKKDKSFLAFSSCRGQEFHKSSFDGTWQIRSGKLMAFSEATNTAEDNCSEACDSDEKCFKECEKDFIKEHGVSEVRLKYTYEFIDRGSNKIAMRLMAATVKKGTKQKRPKIEKDEAAWEELGCLY